MPNEDGLDLYELMGEKAPIWLIAMLLLAGSLGAVASSVMLLLPSDMPFDALNSWLVRSDLSSSQSEPSHSLDSTDQAKKQAVSVTGNNTAEDSSQLPARTKSDLTPSIQRQAGQVSAVSPDLAPASVPAISSPQAEPAPVEFATMETPETTRHQSLPANSVIDQPRGDCEPLYYIYFDRDGTRPRDRNLSIKVNRLHTWLAAHPAAKVTIEGHTDSYGSEEWNLLVSHKRAKMVAKILASVGVPESQMKLRALGENAPLEGLPPESARNRRVALRILDGSSCVTNINQGDKP